MDITQIFNFLEKLLGISPELLAVILVVMTELVIITIIWGIVSVTRGFLDIVKEALKGTSSIGTSFLGVIAEFFKGAANVIVAYLKRSSEQKSKCAISAISVKPTVKVKSKRKHILGQTINKDENCRPTPAKHGDESSSK